MQDFTEFLQKIKFEKQIKNLEKKYKNKTILIYGAGLLFEAIHNNYDLSNLNIIGITDKIKTSDESIQSLYGYQTVKSENIANINPDIILVGVLNPICTIEDMQRQYISIKVAPLVNKGRIEFFREIMRI